MTEAKRYILTLHTLPRFDTIRCSKHIDAYMALMRVKESIHACA